MTIKDAAVPEIHFVRDVQPVLSKLGCNAGTCHGAAKGKNGFKLSLRGYDPEYDYQALINDLSGRRFNRVNVDESLMLLKPTAEVPHEGRQPLKPGSREYHILSKWITEGTKFEDPSKHRAQSIEVLPSDVELDLAGRSQRLLVLAHYPDGSVREVTREAILSSNNGDVAEVKEAWLPACAVVKRPCLCHPRAVTRPGWSRSWATGPATNGRKWPNTITTSSSMRS